jgi:hypothetical protein
MDSETSEYKGPLLRGTPEQLAVSDRSVVRGDWAS